MNIRSLIVAVSGGSCSGKTTFVKKLQSYLGQNSTILYQDHYYKDLSHEFDSDGGKVNFDHPHSLDFDLMEEQLAQLKQGLSVEIPLYDFATHKRKTLTQFFAPKPIIFVDGILILTRPKLRSLFDHSIYIQCDQHIRLERRLLRDVAERGRTYEGVLAQFTKQVAPMHEEFVAPSARYAQKTIHQDHLFDEIEYYESYLESLLKSQKFQTNQPLVDVRPPFPVRVTQKMTTCS